MIKLVFGFLNESTWFKFIWWWAQLIKTDTNFLLIFKKKKKMFILNLSRSALSCRFQYYQTFNLLLIHFNVASLLWCIMIFFSFFIERNLKKKGLLFLFFFVFVHVCCEIRESFVIISTAFWGDLISIVQHKKRFFF